MLFFVAMLAGALAADLTVNGTTVSMYGSYTYDRVQVINGGKITVPDYDGTATKGSLNIVADYIYVDSTSSITADGAGYRCTTPRARGPAAAPAAPAAWTRAAAAATGARGAGDPGTAAPPPTAPGEWPTTPPPP